MYDFDLDMRWIYGQIPCGYFAVRSCLDVTAPLLFQTNHICACHTTLH